MNQNDTLNDLVNTCLNSLRTNQSIERVREELQAGISSYIAKLDLVTVSQFEAQQKSLARTREMVNALEQKIQALEQQSKNTQ